MRGLLVAVLILMWVPLILVKPHVGVLVWSWVSHMNPHGETYGFAYSFPFLDFIAAGTFLGLLITRENKVPPSHPVIILMLIYLSWTVVTTITGFNPDASTVKLTKVFKVFLFAILTTVLMQSPERLRMFLYVMVGSLLFIALKGALFVLLTGGVNRVQGAGGMMQDNNQLAVAMAMTMPLMLYFYYHPPRLWMKLPALALTFTFFISAVGTQSRGGFAALLVTSAMLLLKVPRKGLIILVAIPLALGTYQFMPDSWRDRIETTQRATDDASFRERVAVWRFAVNVVDDYPITGGGFDVFYNRTARELYVVPGHFGRASHSIYFEVLGEHGYVGLTLFLTLMFTGWFSAGAQARRFRPYQETRWLSDLCSLSQVSIVGFMAGGLTVNIAAFDLIYHILAVSVLAHVVGEKIMARGGLTPYRAAGKKAKKREKFNPYASASGSPPVG